MWEYKIIEGNNSLVPMILDQWSLAYKLEIVGFTTVSSGGLFVKHSVLVKRKLIEADTH